MNGLMRKNEGSEVMRRVAEDFEILQQDGARLERKCTELSSTNERLLQEVNILRERNSDLQRERDLLQAYSVTMNTKLDLIVDVVTGVQRDALRMPGKVRTEEASPKTGEVAETRVDPIVTMAESAVERALSSTRMPRIALSR